MLNLYELIEVAGGYQFTNDAGDEYSVYLTTYSLLAPRSKNKINYLDVYMLGFSCKRAGKLKRHNHDAKSKETIISVFTSFVAQFPDSAFLYLCDNRDGLARNRRITFGSWFNETSSSYELHQSHIRFGTDNWYSAILVKEDNIDKSLYIDAYNYTLQQLQNI